MPIAKPDSCKGCPFYELSQWFTPDSIVPNSDILILAQAPGEHEEHGLALQGTYWQYGKKHERVEHVRPQPLIGASGNWLRKEFWPRTKLDYSKVSRANVIKCRPNNSNDLPSISNAKPVGDISQKLLKTAISHCTRNYLTIPNNTKYILSMGEIALYALTGEELLQYKRQYTEDDTTGEKTKRLSTVSEWRGYALTKNRRNSVLTGLTDYCNPHTRSSDEYVIFPVIHLASLFQDEKYYFATLMDFQKFGKLVRGEWPVALPEININTIPTSIPEIIGFDTEYHFEGDNQHSTLEMWSLADKQHNIYVVDAAVSRMLENVPPKLRVVMQNGLVDLPHLRPLIPEGVGLKADDCMLGWAIIHAGQPTSLDYQLSIVGRYNRHKHLRQVKDTDVGYLYAGLDADTTLNDAWRYIAHRLMNDPLLRTEYTKRRGRPLLPILERFNNRGIEVWTERVNSVKALMDAELARIDAEAREITGDSTFNIRSPGAKGQVAAFLYNKPRKVKVKPVGTKRKKKSSSTAIQEELL